MSENDFTKDEYEEALASVGKGGPFVPWTDYLYMKDKYERLATAISVYCREELGNMCFENDQECIDYFLEFKDEPQQGDIL